MWIAYLRTQRCFPGRETGDGFQLRMSKNTHGTIPRYGGNKVNGRGGGIGFPPCFFGYPIYRNIMSHKYLMEFSDDQWSSIRRLTNCNGGTIKNCVSRAIDFYLSCSGSGGFVYTSGQTVMVSGNALVIGVNQ